MSPEQKPTLPIDVYIRVSDTRGREGDRYLSPDIQRERCLAQLKADGLQVGLVEVEEDQSGRKMERPKFDRLMARAGVESGGIIVYKLSRFGRTTKGVIEGIETLEKKGAVLISCEEKLDTSTAMGRFFVRMIASLAELESDNIGDAWKASRSSAVARGIFPGVAAVGYRKTADRTLEPHPVYGPLVTEAFRMRANGAGLTEIKRFFDQHEVPNHSDRPWSVAAVAHMLQNEVYRGVVRHGEYRNEDAHEALVDSGLWHRVQGITVDRGASKPTGESFLRGLVRCGTCGSPMVRNTVTKTRKDGTKARYFQFTCSNKTDPCPAKATISRKPLEAFVASQLLARMTVKVADTEVQETPEFAKAAEAVEQAEGKLAEFDATWSRMGLKMEDAMSMRQALVEERDEAAAALAAMPQAATEIDTLAWAAEWMAGDPREGEVLDSIRAIQNGEGTKHDEEALLWFLSIADPAAVRQMAREQFDAVVVTAVGKGGSGIPVEERVTLQARS